MSNESPGVHCGHRARMRARYNQTGLNGFQAHEVLELILFSAIPKKDVNPLAHALIDQFGSIDAVLSASEEELLEVTGIGKHTSAILCALNAVCDHYAAHRFTGTRTLCCISDVLRHAELSYHRSYTNELIVMYEDSFGSLITVRSFPARLQDPLVLHEALSIALNLRTHSIVLLLKGLHPLKKLSKTLLDEISQLIRLFSGVDIYVVDFILLSGEHVLSLRMEDLLTDAKGGGHLALPMQKLWFEPLPQCPETCGWRHIPRSLLRCKPIWADQEP